MALDGITLYHIKKEISPFVIGSRVDKIHQPSKEEVIITLRSRDGAKKLLLSCRADSARVHFTSFAPENPPKPPMLTMLLRKRLVGAKITDVVTNNLERMLSLEFEGTDDLGDRTKYSLVIEIMGRSSNIILLDKNGDIIDAVKRVDISSGSSRIIMPAEHYALPTPQNKYNIFTDNLNVIKDCISQSEKSVSKAFQDNLLGVSPIICREIENGLSLADFKHYAENPKPVVVIDGVPKDFTFVPVLQYGDIVSLKYFDTYSELLDFFYYEKVRLARIKSRSSDLFKSITTLQERAVRKAANRQHELDECKDKDLLRIYGELITANQYSLEKGSPYYDIPNYYDNGNVVRIPADVRLSPSQNAQKYYKDYRKKQIAQTKLTDFINDALAEAKYLDTVLDALSRASTDAELTAIKSELSDGGYIRKNKISIKNQKQLKPLEYKTSDGFNILVGRNNVMNDRLTLKTAKGNDVWFHTKDTPGSHVIVVNDGRDITDTAIHEASLLAAYNSKARSSSNVPVDYAFVKFVKKPTGAKPGRVIYTDYKTEFVTPTTDEIERLMNLD